MERYYVQADWHAEARVWTSTSNIPGLILETETLPDFIALLVELGPDLLRENAGVLGPTSIELRAKGFLMLAAGQGGDTAIA
jgi:hypothetical protein